MKEKDFGNKRGLCKMVIRLDSPMKVDQEV